MAWTCSCISLLLGGRKTQKRLLACFPNGILITLILALTVDRLFSKKNKWIKIYWAYIDWKDVGPDLWWIHYTSWSVFSMQGLLSGNDCYALVFLKLERVYDRVCMYVCILGGKILSSRAKVSAWQPFESFSNNQTIHTCYCQVMLPDVQSGFMEIFQWRYQVFSPLLYTCVLGVFCCCWAPKVNHIFLFWCCCCWCFGFGFGFLFFKQGLIKHVW